MVRRKSHRNRSVVSLCPPRAPRRRAGKGSQVVAAPLLEFLRESAASSSGRRPRRSRSARCSAPCPRAARRHRAPCSPCRSSAFERLAAQLVHLQARRLRAAPGGCPCPSGAWPMRRIVQSPGGHVPRQLAVSAVAVRSMIAREIARSAGACGRPVGARCCRRARRRLARQKSAMREARRRRAWDRRTPRCPR